MRAALVLALLLAGCGAESDPAGRPAAPEPPPPNATPILITKPDQVAGALGNLVTLQGGFVYSKIQGLLGVDVDGHDLGPDVEKATATGVLRKSVVTKEQLEEDSRKFGHPFANRGPGTFYHLVDPATNRLAKARLLP
jgi:hypothetical protein